MYFFKFLSYSHCARISYNLMVLYFGADCFLFFSVSKLSNISFPFQFYFFGSLLFEATNYMIYYGITSLKLGIAAMTIVASASACFWIYVSVCARYAYILCILKIRYKRYLFVRIGGVCVYTARCTYSTLINNNRRLQMH